MQFYITAGEEIRSRLPINNEFLRKLQVFLPEVAVLNNDREASFRVVSFIAKTLNGFDDNGLKEEWFALYTDYNIEEKQALAKYKFDDMWKEILQCQSNNV